MRQGTVNVCYFLVFCWIFPGLKSVQRLKRFGIVWNKKEMCMHFYKSNNLRFKGWLWS